MNKYRYLRTLRPGPQGREKAKFDPDVHGDKIDVYFKEQNGRGPDHNREYKSKNRLRVCE
mgnify:CR=1 FL=1